MADKNQKDQQSPSVNDAQRKGNEGTQKPMNDLETPKDDADAIQGGLMPVRRER